MVKIVTANTNHALAILAINIPAPAQVTPVAMVLLVAANMQPVAALMAMSGKMVPVSNS